jgi:hypothetical protein
MPLKKYQHIKNSAVGSRIFTLKDLLGELKDRGMNIHKVTEMAESTLAIGGM